MPDAYGLSLLVAGSAAEMIEASTSSQSIAVLASKVLVRIDDVELKGFDGSRPIYTLVPRNDPGLVDFKAARNALDQKRICDARKHLKAVDNGMLQAAAKTLLQRVESSETKMVSSKSAPGM